MSNDHHPIDPAAIAIRAATDDSSMPTVTIDGKPYAADAHGRLTPVEMIKPQDQLMDELVRKIIGYAGDLNAQIARFRSHCADDISAFDSLLEQDYGGHRRRTKKGNRTYLSYDAKLKVQVQISERVAFGPELQVARDLVDECLSEWASGSRAEIRAIVGHAFQTDQEGQISRAAVYSLLRLEIDDSRWQCAMNAIHDAMRVVGSKTYIRCYRRDAVDSAWQPITIDMAKAGD